MASRKGGVWTEVGETGSVSSAADLRDERALARAQRRASLAGLFSDAGLAPAAGWQELSSAEEPRTSGAARARRLGRWRRCLQRGAAAGGGEGGGGGESALDIGHPGEDFHHELTVKDIVTIFHHFRSAGIAPYPGLSPQSAADILASDIAVARAMLQALQRLREQRQAGVPEENLDPSRRFGVLNGVCFLDLDEDFEDKDRRPSQMGWAWDVVVDVALMGGGFLRHQHQPDLIWSSLHHSGTEEGDLFPAPAQMLATMEQDSWARMAGFTLFTIICYLSEMQQMAILFSYGPEAVPGASLSAAVDQAVGYSTVRILGGEERTVGLLGGRESFYEPLDWERMVGLLRQQRPEHQSGNLLFVSEQGWAPFYWDFDLAPRADFEAWREGRIGAEAARDVLAVLYQRFCFDLWDSRPYHQECARRKALGVAAFGDAVGRYLQQLDACWRSLDPSVGLADLVPTLEVGNEWESTWFDYACRADGEPVTEGREGLLNAARFGELARLMVMVSAPIRQHCRHIPFTYRFPDLVGWATDEPFDDWSVANADWYKRTIWVQHVLTQGMAGECDRLDRFQQAELFLRDRPGPGSYPFPDSADYDDFPTWLASCEEAGWTWPRYDADHGWVDFDPAGIMHEAGFHFWHVTTSDDRYCDEQRIAEDVDFWKARITDNPEVQARFGQLAWSVSGIQVQALAPDSAHGGNDPEDGAFFQQMNMTYQAGLLVRRLLHIAGLGSSRVLWHTFMANLNDKHVGWGFDNGQAKGQFNANGMRNDLFDRRHLGSEYPGDYDGFEQEQHAWRRPAWFAYRRLLWLVDSADTISIVHADRGTYLLKLVSNRGFGEPTGDDSVRRRSVAWVAWMDQFSPDSQDHFIVTLSGRTDSSYRVLSLAPAQAPTMVIRPGDGGEYPVGDDDLDWEGDGFGQTTSSASTATGDVMLTVRRAGPDNPAPICVLTDRLSARVMLPGGSTELEAGALSAPPAPLARGEERTPAEVHARRGPAIHRSNWQEERP